MRLGYVFLPLVFKLTAACTSILVSAGASSHGYPMTSHSNDCALCDPRVAVVPRSRRDKQFIYSNVPPSFPRRLEVGRARIYEPSQDQTVKTPLGIIPQYNETLALYESSYPLINEAGLAFGESTTSALPLLDTGSGLFTMAPLMTVAMERCSTARCAIATMGALAEEYGFTGDVRGASETVTIVDRHDAWVFEMTGDGTSKGALWVAKRVPDGEVVVVANTIVIKVVDLDDSDNYMYSVNLAAKLKHLGLVHGHERRIPWQAIISQPLTLPRYASLRMWRVYSKLVPSRDIINAEDPDSYPFSMKPDQPVSITDVMRLFQDHYEGTEYDMTKGFIAGPFGNPSYEFSKADLDVNHGQIPRAISLMRTSYTVVSVSGLHAKTMIAFHAPSSSVFLPLWAEALSSSEYPLDASMGTETGPKLQKFDRYTAFWAFDLVANMMTLQYRNISQDLVFPERDRLQQLVMKQMEEAEEKAENSPTKSADICRSVQVSIQERITRDWWELCDKLIVRYNDGFYNFPDISPESIWPLTYPIAWLQMIGLSDKFLYPPQNWVSPVLYASTQWLIIVAIAIPLSFISGLAISISLGSKSKRL